MTTMVRSCMQSLLKFANSLFGMCGIAMFLYAVWMLKIRQGQVHEFYHPTPWFMYTVLGLGAFLCAMTFWGHIAAETANGCCLYCYLICIFLLLMLEGAVTMDVFYNPNWEQDIPQDPSGNFRKLRDFIQENMEFCKWLGLSILSVEGLSLFLTLVLIAVGPHQNGNDHVDECAPEGVPLLRNYSHQPQYESKADAWNS